MYYKRHIKSQLFIMNFDFQKARDMMVDNQLRPNKIKDHAILDLFKNTKKEDFLSEEIKGLSYSDLDINLDNNRGYIKNLHIAQLIHSADIKANDKVLHLGGLTGYVSVILSSLCKKLIVIENQEHLVNKIKNNIKKLNINNLKIINTFFQDGFIEESPYDIIFIDNPIDKVPNSLKDQLSFQQGRIIMIEKTSDHLCKAYKIIKINNNYTKEYLFDVFTKYELFKNDTEFVF